MRRIKPSRRQVKNLTAFERATGCMPGKHHAQFIDVLHHEQAIVDGQGERTGDGTVQLSRPRLVNCGWVMAADLSSWCRAPRSV
jgi:hypothetical protein